MTVVAEQPSRPLTSALPAAPISRMSRLLRPRMMQMYMDVVAFMLSFTLYQVLRYLLLPDLKVYSMQDHLVVGLVSTAYWSIVFWLGGLYRDYYVRSPFEEFFAAVRLTFLGSAVIFLSIFVTSSPEYQSNPRFVFVLYWFALCTLVCLGRLGARQLQRRLRERRVIRIPSILVGTAERLAELFRDLDDEPAWGYEVIGVIHVDRAERSDVRFAAPTLGGVERAT